MTPELDLNRLSTQIETLLKSRDQLRVENLSLHQKLVKLTNERAILLDKKHKTAEKLKRIINQLRNQMP